MLSLTGWGKISEKGRETGYEKRNRPNWCFFRPFSRRDNSANSAYTKNESDFRQKNIYLTAPGGYGKTIAAAQWLSSVRGKTAKTTAGEADNDPGVFYKRLAMTLLKLRGKETAQAALPPSGISFDKLLEIIRLLPEKSSRRYLLLDDLHMIKNEEIIGNLQVIAKCMPSYICQIQAISKKHNLKLTDETVPKLTAQQRSMLQYLGKGMTYNEIAAATGIERATVKYHILLVYKALGVHDAEEAVLKAKMVGLLE